MRTLGLVAAVVVVGCRAGHVGGPAPEPTRLRSDLQALAPEPTRLRIDMQPVDAMEWAGTFMPEGSHGLRSKSVVAFAWGDGYPAAIEVELPDDPYTACGPLFGTFKVERVMAQDGLDVTITGPSTFRLAPTGEGDFDVVVYGTFVATSPDESCAGAKAEVEVHARVPVRRPVGIAIDRPGVCKASDRFRVETNAHLAGGTLVYLVDAAGEQFLPSNAAERHPATITLLAAPDTQLSLHTPDQGLAALVVSGAPGPISVQAFGGEHEIIEHVEPAKIDVVGVELMLLGMAGTPTRLVSGQVYPEKGKGWGRTSSSIGVESIPAPLTLAFIRGQTSS